MNFYKRNILLPAIALATAMTVFAIPAKRTPFTVTQPDGTELTVRLVGDEHFHYYLTEDDLVLVNVDDTYYYGKADMLTKSIVSTGVVAHETALRDASEHTVLQNASRNLVMESLQSIDGDALSSKGTRRAAAGPGLFPGTAFPSIGEQKAIVILVEYTDVKFTIDNPLDYFNRMVNEEGFSDYGGTGSARDYFIENSSGQFRPQFDVFGPVTLAHEMKYYGANNYSGEDSRPEYMIIEACQQLDDEIDFTQYDRDGDGFIDNVFVFYAGRGENSGGSANSVWPHSYDIVYATSTPYIFDGVRLNRYACTNETDGKRPDGVGTFIHEFSHVMGLPDLYTTTYTSAFTPGQWSALDYGPYNNDGCTPPYYSVFERYALGWIEPKVLDGSEIVSLNPITSNEACIIKTNNDNEFFLFENRQQKGWDTYIPGHGMLVWHIDYNSRIWENNSVNNSASHQYVDLEEADNILTEHSRAGDSFPGTAGVTSFTDDTKPSMKTWRGAALNLPITDITENNGVISFKVAGGIPLPAEVTLLEAADITPRSFTARWNGADDCDTYWLTVTEGVDRTPVKGYNNLAVGDTTAFAVTGLNPGSTYYYTVTGENRAGIGDPSEEAEVTLPAATFDYIIPVVTACATGSNAFDITWEPVEGADDYIVSVYTKSREGHETIECDFTGGILAMPEDWTTDSKMTYGSKAYSGVATPSLRLNRENSMETGILTDDIQSISFWYRGATVTDDNRLDISLILAGNDYWTDFRSLPVPATAGGTVVNIDDMPIGARAVRFTHALTGTGALALDDIVIKWGGNVTVIPVDGYTDRHVSGTTLSLADMPADNVYYFTVTALQGDSRSLPSAEGYITLGNANLGTALVSPDSTALISCNGRHLVAIAADNAATVTVTDIAGRTVATASGTLSATLPASGIYIVRAGNSVSKIAVR